MYWGWIQTRYWLILVILSISRVCDAWQDTNFLASLVVVSFSPDLPFVLHTLMQMMFVSSQFCMFPYEGKTKMLDVRFV